MGIPGCGKSSTANTIAKLLNAECFLEPEEEHWSDIVADRDRVGAFTALMWFRNTRVPNLWKAYRLHQDGQIVVVDSLYDKLIAKYIRDPSFGWLIGRTDPYYEVVTQVAEIDYNYLPDPDILVFVHVDVETWKTLLSKRGRRFDESADIAKEFAMQDVMWRACERYASEKNIKFVMHDQRYDSAESSASDIRKLLWP